MIKLRCWLVIWLTFHSVLSAAAIFTVSNTADSGTGSLRQAVLGANAAAGADTIQFAISGIGPHQIGIAGAALDLNGPLLIDGFTQFDATPNTQSTQIGGLNSILKIVIAPATFGPASSAFILDQGEVTLRGLVISGFGQSGAVKLNGNGAVARIEGCYFGTNAEGTTPSIPSSARALFVQAGRLHIGGLQPEQRNLFSGHSNDVMRLTSAASPDSTIEGNLFGTDVSGSVALANAGAAIRVQALGVATAHHLRIGGTNVSARNVFAAGAVPAIQLDCASQIDCLNGLLIQGNYIGTDATGVVPMGNNASCPLLGCSGARVGGINISGLQLGILNIGGSLPGAGNRIAFNHGAGIGWQISAGLVNGSMQIQRNDMFSNGGLGIELIRNSVSITNDPSDLDEGANRFQNAPILQQAELQMNGTELAVAYHVDTASANASYPLRIDFYRSTDGEEGSQWLGSDIYPVASAQLSKSINLSLSNSNGLPIVATATDAEGHSSKFSNVIGDDVFTNSYE